jgi:uncharacterized SAM-binding protein YcdF (DUF218 family)
MITPGITLAFGFLLGYAARAFASYRRRSHRRQLHAQKHRGQDQAWARPHRSSSASSVLRHIFYTWAKVFYTGVKAVALGLFAATLLVAGSIIDFAYAVYGSGRLPSTQADAIVALSGDPERLRAAVQLLANGYGRRLLIAGLDNSDEIAALYPAHRTLFDCCIDIDPRSGRTAEDAATIRHWALETRPRSLIVVTSNYHIPRALLEVGRALPDLPIVPFGVSTGLADVSEPWRRPEGAELLAREYMKYVAVWAHARD